MRIEFHEEFRLPIDEVFSYFRTPADWVRLYGMFGEVEDRGDGWYAVPMKGFPFPLVGKITDISENHHVCWTFRGFWKGDGEVRVRESEGGVFVEGFEEISVRWLFFLSPLVETLLLERRFRGIWRHGWKNLHRLEAQSA